MKAKFNETYDDFEEKVSSQILNPIFAVNSDLQIEYSALQEQITNLDRISYGEADDKFSPVMAQISLLKNRAEEESRAEEANYINLFKTQCMQEMFASFKNYLGIEPESTAFNLAEDLLYTEGQELLQALYEFFVIYRYENVCNYIKNIIEDNLNDIIAELKPNGDRKDLSLKTERKKLKNPGVALILDKLETVISEIIHGKYEVTDPIIEITKGLEDYWHNAIVLENLELVNVQELSSRYFGNLLYDFENQSDIFSMIVMEIRSKLFKTYAKQG